MESISTLPPTPPYRTCDGRRRPVRSGLCRRRRDRRRRRRRRPRPGRDELDYAAAGSWMCAGDASAADGAGARPRRSPRQHGWPCGRRAPRAMATWRPISDASLYIYGRPARHVRDGWMDGWIGVQMVWQTERSMLFMGPCVTCERQLVCVTVSQIGRSPLGSSAPGQFGTKTKFNYVISWSGSPNFQRIFMYSPPKPICYCTEIYVLYISQILIVFMYNWSNFRY